MSRTSEHEIHPLILGRWSPRAMNGEAIEPALLARLLEAARFAPSGGNLQPWRFVYGLRGSAHFDRLFALLDAGNQAWCVRAGALLVLLSNGVRANGKPNRTASFDAGAAWMAFALQGSSLDLVVHAMGGFDVEGARAAVAAAPDHEVLCMIAVGHPGDPAELSEKDRARETPSARKPQTDWAFEGALSPA